MAQSRYKSRPVPPPRSNSTSVNARGEEVLSPKPHPLLMTSLQAIPMQEQVQTLTRISRIRRQNAVDFLDDPNYFGEDVEDAYMSVEGITPHEIAGTKSFWEPLAHSTPEPQGTVSREQDAPTPPEEPAA